MAFGIGAFVFAPVAIVFSAGAPLLANPSFLISATLGVSSAASFFMRKIKRDEVLEMRAELCPEADQTAVAPFAQSAIVKALSPSKAFAVSVAPACAPVTPQGDGAVVKKPGAAPENVR